MAGGRRLNDNGFDTIRWRSPTMSLDDELIDTPEGPMTWAQWKKRNPVQIPSRRTKGKKLPVKVKRFTGEK
jgi:hypothetical protein